MDRASYAFVAGVIGGWATIFFQRRDERTRSFQKTLFKVYMLLLELKSHHFWIAAAEMHSETASRRALRRFEHTRWLIADQLRRIDSLPDMEEILHVMFSLRFEREGQRADALDSLIDRLGKKLNPHYAQAMEAIGDENQTLMAQDTPEFLRRLRKTQE